MGMRKGLHALRCGKLDQRDMRVFTNVRVVAMSPPNVFGGSDGTVLELHVRSQTQPAELMFGSLVALAPRASFESADLVWATVSGADELSKRQELKIFIELTAGLNDDSDAQLVSLLLRHSCQIAMAESPTFYRAYAPAIAALQAMAPADLPFSEQIVYGRQEQALHMLPSTADASFILTSPEGNEGLTVMDMTDLIHALGHFAGSESKQLRLRSSLTLNTTLDRYQSAAILASLTRRLTTIQGPPGTGKSFTILKLLQLLDSINDGSGTERSPVLIMTFKNRSLENIMGGCMKIWPEGVARCGGSARPGSLLEHRHIKSLLRNDKTRDLELDEARTKAKDLREQVHLAAAALSNA